MPSSNEMKPEGCVALCHMFQFYIGAKRAAPRILLVVSATSDLGGLWVAKRQARKTAKTNNLQQSKAALYGIYIYIDI